MRRGGSNALPSITVNRRIEVADTTSSPSKSKGNKLSYDEAVAGLKAAVRESQNKRFESIRDVIRSVDSTAVPGILREIDKLLPVSLRGFARTQLFGRWAEMDVSAAMAAANAVGGVNDRNAAISAVVIV